MLKELVEVATLDVSRREVFNAFAGDYPTAGIGAQNQEPRAQDVSMQCWKCQDGRWMTADEMRAENKVEEKITIDAVDEMLGDVDNSFWDHISCGSETWTDLNLEGINLEGRPIAHFEEASFGGVAEYDNVTTSSSYTEPWSEDHRDYLDGMTIEHINDDHFEVVTKDQGDGVGLVAPENPKGMTPHTFIADSGASSHMGPSAEGMYDFDKSEDPSTIRFGIGKAQEAALVGSRRGTAVQVDGTRTALSLSRYKQVTGLWTNLFS